MKHYYAAQWIYGLNIYEGLKPACHVLRWTCENARNKWVADGTPYSSAPYFREAITAKRALIHLKRGNHGRWEKEHNSEMEVLIG